MQYQNQNLFNDAITISMWAIHESVRIFIMEEIGQNLTMFSNFISWCWDGATNGDCWVYMKNT